jgi:hypothetical protein
MNRISMGSNVGSATFLSVPDSDAFVDGYGGYLHGDFHTTCEAASYDQLVEFADDVADGWLDELRSFLQARADKAAEGAKVLASELDAEYGARHLPQCE